MVVNLRMVDDFAVLFTPFILGPCLLVWTFWFVIRLWIYELDYVFGTMTATIN